MRKRTAILVMDMKEASDLPRIAEPWFLALNAAVEVTPAMIPADLQKAGRREADRQQGGFWRS